METCQVCDGQLAIIGFLGKRCHCRCQNCGLDQSFVPDEATRAEIKEALANQD